MRDEPELFLPADFGLGALELLIGGLDRGCGGLPGVRDLLFAHAIRFLESRARLFLLAPLRFSLCLLLLFESSIQLLAAQGIDFLLGLRQSDLIFHHPQGLPLRSGALF